MNIGEIIRILRRLMMMIGGEAMQSGYHFAVNLVLLHKLSAHNYGVFAIVMVIGGIGLTYVRSLSALPASILIGQSRTANAADAHDVTFGSVALLLSVLIGCCVALLLEVWLHADAISGGLFVGLWCMRSHMRIAFFARRWQNAASLSDLVFTLSGLVGLLFIVTYEGNDPLDRAFTVLAVANGLSLAALLVLARHRIRISFGRTVRRRYHTLGKRLSWSAISVTISNLQGQSVSLLVSTIAGPAAYAPIAAVVLLFVPLRVGITAMGNLLQPSIARLLGDGKKTEVWRLCKTWSALSGAAGIVYGAAMFFLLPHIQFEALQGVPVQLLGLLAWAVVNATMFYVMPLIVLEAMMAFRTIAMITAAAAVVGAGTILVLLHIGPPSWALGGGALSELVVLAGCWWFVRKGLTQTPARRPAAELQIRPAE